MIKNLLAMQESREMRVQSLGQEDSLEEEMATHSSILAWKIPWQRHLAGCSLWGRRELDMTQHILTHSSVSRPGHCLLL